MKLSGSQTLAVEAYKAGIHEEMLGYACEQLSHCVADLSLVPAALVNLRKSHPQMFRDADESKMTSYDRWNLQRSRNSTKEIQQ